MCYNRLVLTESEDNMCNTSYTDCSGNIIRDSRTSVAMASSKYVSFNADVSEIGVYLTDFGENCMSLCFAIIYPFAAYIAADSRSSIGKGEINIFSKNHIKRVVDSDNYKKIFRLPFNDKRVYGFSTGTNKFIGNSMTVTDVVKKYSSEGAVRLLEQASHLCNVFFQKKPGVSFTLIEFDNELNHFRYVCADATNNDISIKEHLVDQSGGVACVYSGSDWAKLILNYVNVPSLENITDENIKSTITEIFEKAYAASDIYDNSVGGEYHLLKITPGGGEEWLHGGYDL